MPRPKSPDGKSIHENVRLSENEAAEIDAVRGSQARGPWMREAALRVARGEFKRDTGIQLTTAGDERQAPLERHPTAGRCLHPANRRIGKFCGACEQDVK